MAMTTCPQCDEAMSGYAPVCPHCHKVNPAAPQAILRQEKVEFPSLIFPALTEKTLVERKPESLPSSPAFLKSEYLSWRWLLELRQEWTQLTPPRKVYTQALFTLAIAVGIGFLIYVALF